MNFKKGNEEEARRLCEQAIRLCKLFRQKKEETNFLMRYKHWQNGWQDPKFKELVINVGFFGEEEI